MRATKKNGDVVMGDGERRVFFKELCSEDKKDLLHLIVKSRKELYVWKKGIKKIQKFKVTGVGREMDGHDKINIESTLILYTPEFRTDFLNTEVLISFLHDNFQYFAKSILKLDRSSNYYIKLDKEIYKCEKRGGFRMCADRRHPISITINNKIYPALDVSVGGVGFMVKSEEEGIFVKKQNFSECLLKISGQIYTISSCEVANAKLIEGKGLIKVGIKFSKLPQRDEVNLCRLINQSVFLSRKKAG
ncbi:MAG: hypothetical protein HQK49_16830 [Oligoflexia bacterium]|nr:hypothetical protein [Oligoflexia bacterium]